MHVYLIGMPGSGKTTLGRALAAHLDRKFLDLDEEIERITGQTITQLFEAAGEAHFRELEREVLKTVANAEGKLVVATGGGTPCFYENMALMNWKGLTVYLKTAPETLAGRLFESGLADRPLLKNKNKPLIINYLQETLKVRATFYEQAGIVFERPGLQSSAVAALAAIISRFERTV